MTLTLIKIFGSIAIVSGVSLLITLVGALSYEGIVSLWKL